MSDAQRPLGVLVSAAVLSPSPSPLPPSPSGRKHTVSPTSIFLLIGIWVFIVLLGCRLMFTMMGLVSNCFCCCCAVGPSRTRSTRARTAAGETAAAEQRAARRARRQGVGYDTAMAGFSTHTRTISDATIQTFPVRTFKPGPGMAARPRSETPTLPLYTSPPSTPPPGALPHRPASTYSRAATPPRSPILQRYPSRSATPGPVSPPPTTPRGDYTTVHIPAEAAAAPRPDTAPPRDTSPTLSHRRAHSLDVEASTSHPIAQLAASHAADSRAAKLYTVAGPETISTSTGAGAGSGEGLRVGGRAPGGDLARPPGGDLARPSGGDLARPPGGELARPPSTGVLAQLGAGLDWLRSRAAGATPEPGAAAAAPSSDGVACPICLGDYEDGDLVRTLPCKHEFHVECIDPWMGVHPTCPVCRHDLLAYEVGEGVAVERAPSTPDAPAAYDMADPDAGHRPPSRA